MAVNPPCSHQISTGQCYKLGTTGPENAKLPCVYPFCEKNGMHFAEEFSTKQKSEHWARFQPAPEVYTHTETPQIAKSDSLMAKEVETTTRPKIIRRKR